MILIVVLLFQFSNFKAIYAFDEFDVRNYLEIREKSWPEWNIPSLRFSDTSKDLIYPDWFEGNWLVTSINLNKENEKPIQYEVSFYRNHEGKIVGDRKKNSESLGKAILGDDLIKVKVDPQSFNNQITFLKGNQYIESRINYRKQILDDQLFLADEFVIQNVHIPGASRLNQVETMSRFELCKKFEKDLSKNNDICGFQYLNTYGSKVGDQSLNSVTSNKFELHFKFIGN